MLQVDDKHIIPKIIIKIFSLNEVKKIKPNKDTKEIASTDPILSIINTALALPNSIFSFFNDLIRITSPILAGENDPKHHARKEYLITFLKFTFLLIALVK